MFWELPGFSERFFFIFFGLFEIPRISTTALRDDGWLVGDLGREWNGMEWNGTKLWRRYIQHTPLSYLQLGEWAFGAIVVVVLVWSMGAGPMVSFFCPTHDTRHTTHDASIRMIARI